jgi:hypothetical protein
MQFSRRQIIALSGAVAVAGAIGGTLGSWWNQGNYDGLHTTSLEEALFLDAVAEAAFPRGGNPPLGGGEAGVAWYVDGVLLAMEETQRNLLRLSLHAFDAATLPTHGVFFRELPPQEALIVFKSWMNHPLPELRSAFSSIYLFVGMAYTSHPTISAHLNKHFRCGFGA